MGPRTVSPLRLAATLTLPSDFDPAGRGVGRPRNNLRSLERRCVQHAASVPDLFEDAFRRDVADLGGFGRHDDDHTASLEGPLLVRNLVERFHDGNLLVFDTVKMEPIETIRLGKPHLPMGMAITSDGKTLYVATGRGATVFALDLSTNKVTGSFATDGRRSWGVALSPDGKLLYTANGPSNDVSVVDLATQKVLRKLTAGDRPWGALALTPGVPGSAAAARPQ